MRGGRIIVMLGGDTMLYYALVFLMVGLIAGALGLAGIAAVAGQITWILFLMGIVFLLIHLARERDAPIAWRRNTGYLHNPWRGLGRAK